MKINLVRSIGAFVFGALVSASSSPAVVIGGINYTLTSPTESLTAVFTTPTGGSTVNLYGGLVQVTVSGSGNSLSALFNDAFYVYDDGPPFSGDYYQLTFGTIPLVGFDPGQEARHRIVYDLDAGIEVTPTYVPAYRSDHVYSIVLDTGLLAPGTLYFGVSDGNFNDNNFEYRISVTQLAPDRRVPDSGATGVMLTGGLLVLAGLRRRYGP